MNKCALNLLRVTRCRLFIADNPSGLEDNTVVDRIEQANEGKSFSFFHIQSLVAKLLTLLSQHRNRSSLACEQATSWLPTGFDALLVLRASHLLVET